MSQYNQIYFYYPLIGVGTCVHLILYAVIQLAKHVAAAHPLSHLIGPICISLDTSHGKNMQTPRTGVCIFSEVKIKQDPEGSR